MRALRARLALLACLALAPLGALAQEEVAAPITVEAAPKVALPGAAVALSGTTPPVPEGAVITVRLVIDTTPNEPGGDDGEAITREVSPGTDGSWTLALEGDDTATLGRYAVTVTGPDGKGTAEGSFDIVDGDAMGELLNATIAEMNQSLDATDDQIVVSLADLTLGLPPGEIRDEMVVLVDKVIKKIREARPHRMPPLPPMPPAPAPAPGEPPPAPVDFEPVMETFRQVTAESNRVRSQIRNAREKTDNCARMDALIETLNLTSSLMNFLGGSKVVQKPFDIALNLFSDKIWPAFMERAAAAKTVQQKNAVFAGVSAGKVAVANLESLQGIVKGVPGLVFDATNHATKYFYEKYCERFEGPFTATLAIDFRTDEGELYYNYIIKLGGLASLSQPKAQHKGEVATVTPMRGRFDGQAIYYQVQQDAMKLAPNLRSMLVFEKFIAPQGRIRLPPAEMGTMFNTMAHPLGFQIPIKAERKGDIVTMNFGDAAIRDMDPKINRGLLVQVFGAGPIPAPNYQVFPIENAYYILTRGMRSNAKFERKTVAGVEHLQASFKRTETPPGITLNWTVDVDMCNPGCTTTSLDLVQAWYDDYAKKRDAKKKK
ncbi:MAG: hypothetical protein KA196_08015 [Arenimonas sp.]|nr:hypothetical protein [Arenimonas sp.]